MRPERGIYLYAVVPAAVDLGARTGVGDAPVETIAVGAVAAVASEVGTGQLAALNDDPGDPDALADLALTHEAVVRAAMAAGDAVLPFRLGTVLLDRDALRRFLDERSFELRTALERVAGCHEWGVKVTATAADDEPVAEPVPAASQPGVGSGTAYLLRRREQLARGAERDRARTVVAGEVAGALRALALDSTPGRRADPGLLLDEGYLVPRPAEQDFLATADRYARALAAEHLALHVRGPWPPYSFAVPAGGEARHG